MATVQEIANGTYDCVGVLIAPELVLASHCPKRIIRDVAHFRAEMGHIVPGY